MKRNLNFLNLMENRWKVLVMGVALGFKEIIQAALWRTDHKGTSDKAGGPVRRLLGLSQQTIIMLWAL